MPSNHFIVSAFIKTAYPGLAIVLCKKFEFSLFLKTARVKKAFATTHRSRHQRNTSKQEFLDDQYKIKKFKCRKILYKTRADSIIEEDEAGTGCLFLNRIN